MYMDDIKLFAKNEKELLTHYIGIKTEMRSVHNIVNFQILFVTVAPWGKKWG